MRRFPDAVLYELEAVSSLNEAIAVVILGRGTAHMAGG
jgi:hypothetical protein